MNLIKEIEIKGYPKDNTPLINVFDDGTSYLLIDDWPMEDDDRFTDNEVANFEQILRSIQADPNYQDLFAKAFPNQEQPLLGDDAWNNTIKSLASQMVLKISPIASGVVV